MAITEWGFGPLAEKKLQMLRLFQGGKLRIIDVGGGKEKHFPDKFDFVEAVFDILPAPESGSAPAVWFQGDLNDERDWRTVVDFVDRHGKFAFSFCTHTLEDLRNPLLTARMLPQVSERGLVSFPSKMLEASRIELDGSYRGYRHHRWVHDLRRDSDGPLQVTAFPKIGTFEHRSINKIASTGIQTQELWVLWEGSFPYELFQSDHLGPSSFEFAENYLSALVETPVTFGPMVRRVLNLQIRIGELRQTVFGLGR